MANLHISISAEPIAFIGNFPVTNSIFASLIVSGILIFTAIYANSHLKNTRRPKGLQNILEMLVDGMYNLTHNITESTRKTALIFPVTTTFFLFILLNNWIGLLPGVGTIGLDHEPTPTTTSSHSSHPVSQIYALEETQPEPPESTQHSAESTEHSSAFVPIFRAGSADLNTTIALALFSIVFTQFIGFKFLGLSYLSKFFNFKSAIFTFVGFLELVSEFAKIISFAFRLFGNIFAGEVLLVVIGSLLPAVAPIPFLFLEIMVGAIQALVFAMLSIVFMNMATQSHVADH